MAFYCSSDRVNSIEILRVKYGFLNLKVGILIFIEFLRCVTDYYYANIYCCKIGLIPVQIAVLYGLFSARFVN